MRLNAWLASLWLLSSFWSASAGAQKASAAQSRARVPAGPYIVATVSLTSDQTRTLLHSLLDRRQAGAGADGVAILRVSPGDAKMWTASAERRSSAGASRPAYFMGWAPPPTTQRLQPGQERTFMLNWPDDAPRFYVEREPGEPERRVQLTDREGYTIVLRAPDSSPQSAVEVEITRKAFVGAEYDEAAQAFIGRPALMKTVCSTTVPLAAGMATVAQWEVPDEIEQEHNYYGRRKRASMPGVAVVVVREGTDAVLPAPEYGPTPALPRVEPVEDE
jgi:hypothetical protein